MTLLDDAGRRRLTAWLDESPENTFTLHALRTGDGTAHAIESQGKIRAALVVWKELADWPYGYGDPQLIVELLSDFGPWGAVCVDEDRADEVAAALTERMRREVLRQSELFFSLERTPVMAERSPARLLTAADEGALRRSADQLDGVDPKAGLPQQLEERLIAGVVIGDRVVAVGDSDASTSTYGDVGVATLPEHRQRGYASNCGALVAKLVQDSGRIPTWCTGADNLASRRTAAAIGFSQVARRENLSIAVR